jgi:hypothetical protein
MEEGMGEWIQRQAARPQFRNDRSPHWRTVFQATEDAIRQSSWDVAHARLRPLLDTVLAGAVADRYEGLVKQLYLLARMHGTCCETHEPTPMPIPQDHLQASSHEI